MDTKITLEKLSNNNYFNLKFKMEMLLRKEGAWISIETHQPPAIEASKRQKWKDADEKARALIGLSVNDNQLPHLRNERTAKACWDALKKFHEQDTLVNITSLMRNLWTMRLPEDKDPQRHIEEMQNILQQIVDLGEDDLSERWKIGILLSSLPDSYHTLRTALETRDSKDLKLSLVQSKVIEEYQRRSSSSKYSGEEKVFNVKNAKKQIFCHYCKKPNHIMKYCRQLKNKKQSNNVNTIHENMSEANEMLFQIANNSVNNWMLDSGATSHYSNDKQRFNDLDETFHTTVTVANSQKINILGIGQCKSCFVNDKGEVTTVTLTNVLYAPDLNGNFISISKLINKGYLVNFYGAKAEIIYNRKQLAVAPLSNNLFELKSEKLYTTIEIKSCIHYWHRVFGHRDIKAIDKMVKKRMIDIKIEQCNCGDECEICIEAKMTRKAFSKSKARTTNDILELIHTDLCGPMRTQTPSGHRYILTFIDDYSRYTYIYFLKKKNEVKKKLIEFVQLMKTAKRKKPIKFNCDRGGEYLNNELKEYLMSKGIEIQFTPGYTPQLNGIAERKNRSLVEMARCMLLDAGISMKYWGEAVNTANYLQNRIITRATNQIPFEIWNNQKVYIKHLNIFGTSCYVKTPNEKRHKFENA